jgi:8-oxo-dGTP pyrophosphatase MutT (NUDIX family)
MTGPEPVTPRDAATVILVHQPADGPFTCFMVRRHVRSEFAPDVYVFPGGKVDAADRDPALVACIDVSLPTPADLDFPDRDLGFRIAAIRELFEEAAVLLATSGGGLLRIEGVAVERFARWRSDLQAGRVTMASFALETGIRFTPDLLVPFSRWITPVTMPRRYDTRFFLACMPEGQEPLHDALETTDSVWISPAEALRRYHEGDFPLVFATIKHLERLAPSDSIDALIAAIAPGDLAPITPQILHRDGETHFLLPGDSGYTAI